MCEGLANSGMMSPPRASVAPSPYAAAIAGVAPKEEQARAKHHETDVMDPGITGNHPSAQDLSHGRGGRDEEEGVGIVQIDGLNQVPEGGTQRQRQQEQQHEPVVRIHRRGRRCFFRVFRPAALQSDADGEERQGNGNDPCRGRALRVAEPAAEREPQNAGRGEPTERPVAARQLHGQRPAGDVAQGREPPSAKAPAGGNGRSPTPRGPAPRRPARHTRPARADVPRVIAPAYLRRAASRPGDR